MKPVTFKTELNNHSVVTMVGYPTTVPGLVVNAVYAKCDDECGWTTTHLRSGLSIGFCWGSPEAALGYAEKIAGLADWLVSGQELKPLLKPVRRTLSSIGYDCGGRIHRVGSSHVTAHIDNAAIA